MPDDNSCSKCKSTRIIPQARIIDRVEASTDSGASDLVIVLYDDPDALIFKGKHYGVLSARICGDCGYTELFVSNPKELLSAYLKSNMSD
jgi:predicted nucleic-acid-binding Zn-ribbon protein